MPSILRLYVFSLFCPFLLGAITKTDVGPLFVVLAFVVVLKYSEPLRINMIVATLLGIFGILLACYINLTLSPVKYFSQFFGTLFVLTSFGVLTRRLEDLCRLSILLFRFLSVTYILSTLSPFLSDLLSQITFVHRSSSSVLIRSTTGFLGEPSFAAHVFSGFILILLAIRQGAPELTSKKSFILDLCLCVSACISTRSATSLMLLSIIGLPLVFLPSLRTFSSFLFSKINIYIIGAILLLSFFPAAVPLASIRSVSLFSNIITNSGFDILLRDTSVAQRFLNINIFLTKFPFSVDFLFGTTFSSYASAALETIHNSPFNYSSLFISSHTYYTAQVSAYPVLYFTVGLIPAIAYAALIALYITSLRVKIPPTPLAMSAFLYLVFSVISGPSLIFPLPMFVVSIVLALERKVNTSYSDRAILR